MEAGGKRYVSYPSRSNWFTLYNLSDLHYGNRACALDILKADIERIRVDPFALWTGGGDYAEYISYRDRRFDPDTVIEQLGVKDLGKLGQVLTDRVGDLLRPIANQCLGMVFGNHESVYQRAQEQQHLHAELCASLGVPNLGYSGLFDIAFVRNPHVKKPSLSRHRQPLTGYPTETFRVFIHHGAGFAQTPGGKLNRLIQFMHAFDADIYMVGHVHDQKGQRLPTIGANAACDKIVARERLGIVSGGYLKTYAQGVTSYGEMRAYQPTHLGAAFVRIRPDTREMKGEI